MSARSQAMKEGREARKDGRARRSPYEGVAILSHLHQPWLDGWDDMDRMEKGFRIGSATQEQSHDQKV